MNSTQRPSLLRKKQFWLRLTLAILTILVVGQYIAEVLEGRRLVADIRSNGAPVTVTDLNRFYQVPAGFPDTTKLWLAAIRAAGEATTTFPRQTVLLSHAIPSPDEPWEDSEGRGVWLAANGEVVRLLQEAGEAGGRVRLPIDLTAGLDVQLDDTQNCRAAALLLLWHAFHRAHSGDFSTSYNDVVYTLRLLNCFEHEPLLISQLVRIAIQAMTSHALERLSWYCSWSDQQLSNLQAELAATDWQTAVVVGLYGERANLIQANQEATFPLFRSANLVAGLKPFAGVLTGIEQNWIEARRAAKAAEAEVNALQNGNKLKQGKYAVVLLMMPAFDLYVKSGTRATAKQRCTILGLAIRRHWLKTGKVVEDLSQLPDELIGGNADQIRRDPFNAQPLLFQRDEHQFTIYSVGENQVDDGGKVEADGGALKDIGFTVITHPANDGAAEPADAADQPSNN